MKPLAKIVGFLAVGLLVTAALLFEGFSQLEAQSSRQCITADGELPVSVPQPLNSIFTQAAHEWDTDPIAVAVVYYSENGWEYRDPPPPYGSGPLYRSSPVGASGPFQFMPSTWAGYKASNPVHQPGNIQDLTDAAYAAAHFLSDLGAKPGTPLGDISDPYAKSTIINALASYNAGPAGYFGNTETQRYITRGYEEYARLVAEGVAPEGVTSTCTTEAGVDIADTEGNPSTENLVCAAGSDIGIHRTAKGNVIRICNVRGLTVNASVSAQVEAMFVAAEADGITFGGSGFRTIESQIALRRAHCGSSDYAIWKMPSSQCRPDTAIPGNSQHEQGLALDLSYNGRTIRTHRNPGFRWLASNANTFGFKNLPSEPWHWSTNGK